MQMQQRMPVEVQLMLGGNDSDYNSAMNSEIPSPIFTLLDNGGVNDTLAVSGTSHSTDR